MQIVPAFVICIVAAGGA